MTQILGPSTFAPTLLAMASMPLREGKMSDLAEIHRLLGEIAAHINAGSKADRRLAADKLNQLASIATTAAFMTRPKH